MLPIPRRKKSTETHTERTQILELTGEKCKASIILTMSKNSKKMMVVISEQMGNLSKEIKTVRVKWLFQN